MFSSTMPPEASVGIQRSVCPAVAALIRVTDRFTYVSTAGGAFLEWLEGKTLPGVEVLGSFAAAEACNVKR